MNEEIVCFIDMFSLTQNVQIGEKIIPISTNEISKILPSLCYSNHTNKIHLFGNDIFIDGMNIIFKATFTNTGECSVTVNELGVKQIKNSHP